MSTIYFTTLAAVRSADPEKFDSIIRSAVYAAAKDMDHDTLVRALSKPKFIEAEKPLRRVA
jgi:hypothetical protein